MAVYIDPLMACVSNDQWRWDQSCHMWADSEAELHTFANRLGLRREWYQDKTEFKHYDLTARRRVKAVALGAVEVTRKELVTEIRKRRGL